MNIPLPERMRPKKISDLIGQDTIIGNGKIISQILKNKKLPSLILWGPPGSGKTTIARIFANEFDSEFIELSAVTSGKKDVEKVIEHAKENRNLGKTTVLFIDEIHRFSKSQQDLFLPHVESGLITLIGATTENPSFEVISPLLSRSQLIVLKSLNKKSIITILNNAIKELGVNKKIDKEAIDFIAEISGGDARNALNKLELALNTQKELTLDSVQKLQPSAITRYDKKGDAHYDIASAFIKSMRGSDVDATLYYLARMLQAGEDPKFIARRMIIFASEDIGLAGNGAIGLSVSAFDAVERVGLPEAEYILFHVATALAKSKKSRETTDLMNKFKSLARKYPNAEIPLHVRNAPTHMMQDLGYSKNYKWEAGYKHPKGFLSEEIKKHL